jgi:hypothetical protein
VAVRLWVKVTPASFKAVPAVFGKSAKALFEQAFCFMNGSLAWRLQ